MPVILSIAAADLDDETLQALTRQLRDDLRDEANLEAVLVTQAAEAGTKGDIELIGQILLKAVGAGGALAVSGVALFNVLKVYAARKPSLTGNLSSGTMLRLTTAPTSCEATPIRESAIFAAM